jgi:hypothetical protein
VIAREWLPILRVGDAFFFYSVYLSMANRETESSWGSLRTQAEYLQCSVDLIVRGNRLLEICELVHIETGNQHTSNEYYILEPPSLTPELKARIHQHLDDIAQQETSKNWLSWVAQVRKALDRHRTLPDIWADRRARRGGRPVKTVRPGEIAREKKGACDSQPGHSDDTRHNGNGDRESQPRRSCPTTSGVVRHTQGARDPQPEQDRLTRKTEQGEKKEISPLFVRAWLGQLGVTPPIIAFLEERYSTQRILEQLEWLSYRNPRDPAAMLVSAVQGNWDPPDQALAKEHPGGNAQGNGCGRHTRERAVPPAASGLLLHDGSSPATLPGNDPIAEEGGFVLDGTTVDVRDAWAQLLAEMRLQMTRATFDTWLAGTAVASAQGDEVSVLVRDGYAAEWLQARWNAPIERTLSGIVEHPLTVRFLAPVGMD